MIAQFVQLPEMEEHNTYLLSALAHFLASSEFIEPVVDQYGADFLNGPLYQEVERIITSGLTDTEEALGFLGIINTYYDGDFGPEKLARIAALEGSAVGMFGVILWMSILTDAFLPANRDVEAEGIEMDEALLLCWANVEWSK